MTTALSCCFYGFVLTPKGSSDPFHTFYSLLQAQLGEIVGKTFYSLPDTGPRRDYADDEVLPVALLTDATQTPDPYHSSFRMTSERLTGYIELHNRYSTTQLYNHLLRLLGYRYLRVRLPVQMEPVSSSFWEEPALIIYLTGSYLCDRALRDDHFDLLHPEQRALFVAEAEEFGFPIKEDSPYALSGPEVPGWQIRSHVLYRN